MIDFVLRVIVAGGYLGFAALMALENVFPPIPSEVVMGFGGIAAARGEFDLVALVLIGTVGATLGNYAWYALGARLGERRLRHFVERHGRWLTLDWQDVERLRGKFRSRGGRIVFTFRFLPPFRSIISLPAGIARMSVWRFLAFTFAGSAIWNAAWATAGYLLHLRFRVLEDYVGWLGVALFVGAALLYLYRIATWRPGPVSAR
jgi:membrane protein DedA with SNARE-associated domain